MALLKDACREYEADLALARGVAKNTRLAYKRDIADFTSFLAKRGTSETRSIVRRDISDWMEDRLARGLAASTRARGFVAVRGFVKYLAAMRETGEDPLSALKAPKKNRALPKTLTTKETLRLIETCATAEPRDLRDRAMLLVLWGCGLRVSELCALTFENILADARLVRCTGKGSKTRLVPIAPPALAAIDRYAAQARNAFARDDRTREIFLTRLGRPFTRAGFFKIVKQRAAVAGLPPERVSPHVLRHSFASDLLQGGSDIRSIQEMLGHASIATTQIYTHVDEKRFQSTHELLGR